MGRSGWVKVGSCRGGWVCGGVGRCRGRWMGGCRGG